MSRKKKFAVLTGVLAALAAVGIAFAAWTGTGTGQGRARSVTVSAATVNPVNGTADLYPGYTQGDLYFTITNNNPYPITFTSMTPGTLSTTNPVGCPADPNISVSSASGLSLVAPANSTTGTLSISNVVSMDAGAGDGCQNQSFDIDITLNGAQS
jgi:hypothetical protein